MRAGYGKTEITPPLGVELAGYGYYLKRRATRVDDPLFVRAVALEDHAHDIQPQAAAAGAAVAGAVLAVKGLEEVGEGLVLYVRAGVFHGKRRALLNITAPHAHFRPLGRVERGV